MFFKNVDKKEEEIAIYGDKEEKIKKQRGKG